MKTIISTLLIASLLLVNSEITAQAEKDTIWYDANWNVASKNVASYYRPSPSPKDNGFWLIDYHISGKKQMEAWSNAPDTEFFNGTVTWYYENGNVTQTVNYKNNILEGERRNYHENGKLKSQYSYKDGEIDGPWISFYDNSKKNEEGQYKNGERIGSWKEYHKDGRIKGEGQYKKDKKVGRWMMHYYSGTEGKE